MCGPETKHGRSGKEGTPGNGRGEGEIQEGGKKGGREGGKEGRREGMGEGGKGETEVFWGGEKGRRRWVGWERDGRVQRAKKREGEINEDSPDGQWL